MLFKTSCRKRIVTKNVTFSLGFLQIGSQAFATALLHQVKWMSIVHAHSPPYSKRDKTDTWKEVFVHYSIVQKPFNYTVHNLYMKGGSSTTFSINKWDMTDISKVVFLPQYSSILFKRRWIYCAHMKGGRHTPAFGLGIVTINSLVNMKILFSSFYLTSLYLQ